MCGICISGGNARRVRALARRARRGHRFTRLPAASSSSHADTGSSARASVAFPRRCDGEAIWRAAIAARVGARARRRRRRCGRRAAAATGAIAETSAPPPVSPRGSPKTAASRAPILVCSVLNLFAVFLMIMSKAVSRPSGGGTAAPRFAPYRPHGDDGLTASRVNTAMASSDVNDIELMRDEAGSLLYETASRPSPFPGGTSSGRPEGSGAQFDKVVRANRGWRGAWCETRPRRASLC